MKEQKLHKAFPLRFLVSVVALLLGWVILYEGYLSPKGQPDTWLTQATAIAGQKALQAVGYSTQLTTLGSEQIVLYQGQEILGIAKNCNGLSLFALFAGFILLFPGATLHKLWYIPMGIALLFLMNALRVAALTLIQLHHPSWLDFNHKYTFTIVVYALVFAFWMGWVHLQKRFLKTKWQGAGRKLQVS